MGVLFKCKIIQKNNNDNQKETFKIVIEIDFVEEYCFFICNICYFLILGKLTFIAYFLTYRHIKCYNILFSRKEVYNVFL